jgi:hypothetical protein
MIGDIWYRYIDLEHWDSWRGPDRKIVLVELVVIDETPKTVLLARRAHVGKDLQPNYDWVERKRVLKNARRRWAYPTKALALNSYRIRKEWQADRARRVVDRADACRAAVAIIEGLLS